MESSESTQTGEVTQAEGAQEYVELHEADDSDIQAFLDNAEKQEFAPQEAQQPSEPAKEQQQKQVEPPPEQQPDPKEAVSRKEMEAMRKQLEGLELLNKRRTSEFAEFKKQLRSYIENNSKGLDEKFLESPSEGYAQMRRLEEAQQKLMQVEAEEQAVTNATQAQMLLAHHVGTDGLDFEAIAETLQADNMPQDFVQAFMANPYQAALPETLIQLAKRSQDRKKLRMLEQALSEIVPFAEQLIAERKKLPNDVLKNVSSALRQGPQVTGSAGGTGQIGSNRSVEPSMMSDKELEEFLKG
jgi:hypothetical protein